MQKICLCRDLNFFNEYTRKIISVRNFERANFGLRKKILNEISQPKSAKIIHSGLFFFYAILLSVRKCNKIVLFADYQACARTRIKRNLIYFSLTISVSNAYKIICLFIIQSYKIANPMITYYQSKT